MSPRCRDVGSGRFWTGAFRAYLNISQDRDNVVHKRSSPRFPVVLQASVTFADGKVLPCMIRDYCSGGMYLVFHGLDEALSESLAEQWLMVSFDDPLKPLGAGYRIEARIARVLDQGLGLAFREEHPEAVVALSLLASQQASEERGETPTPIAQYGEANVGKLVKKCQVTSLEHIELMMLAFFKQAREALNEAASDTSGGAQPSLLHAARGELHKAESTLAEHVSKKLERAFALLTDEHFISPFAKQVPTESSGLSLVDSVEFEQWLAVRAMVVGLEEVLEETLWAIENRLAELSVNDITQQNNPIGPFMIVSILREEIDRLDLDQASRGIIFESLAQVMRVRLKKLYDELNANLIASGILPTLAKKYEVISMGSPSAGRRRPSAGDSAGAGTAGSGAETGHTSAGIPTPFGTLPMEAHGSLFSYKRRGAASMGDGQAPQDGSAAVPAGQAIPQWSLQELMRLQQIAGMLENLGVVERPAYDSKQLLAALDRLQLSGLETGQLDHTLQDLAGSLGEMTGEDIVGLSAHDQDVMRFVSSLFAAMSADPEMPAQAHDWYARLQLPLLKAALIDGSLLDDDEHPARQLLNRLASIAEHLPGDASALAAIREQVDKVLQDLPERVEEDPEVFLQALDQVERLDGQLQEGYRANLRKLVAECDHEHQLAVSRRQLLDALNERLGQRTVPVIVLNLLESGWKNLLLRTLIKQGANSVVYKTYLNVIDQLTARLTGNPPYAKEGYMPDEKLLEWIGRMINLVSRDEEQNAQLMQQITRYLHGTAKQPAAVRKVAAIAVRDAAAEFERPENIDEDVWQLLLDDTRQLELGERLRYEQGDGDSIPLYLAWIDQEQGRYVFADRHGQRALELHAGELALHLFDKRLARSEAKQIAATERATYNFLQEMNQKLAYQAQHDALTGLLNRKGFEEVLKEAWQEAQTQKCAHVLAYLDLDRFNLINSSCGYEEGDRLLVQVAELIKASVGDEAVLAHLGGDEFGMLLRNTRRTKGLMLVTKVHDRLRQLHYSCANNSFKITASIGVCDVNSDSEGVSALLGAVDAAAALAKENGRDNIQVYHPDDQRITARRSMMEWVGRIEQLLEQKRLTLRCQKIASLAVESALPHYEILLDAQDQQGNPIPLAEFLYAAERYERIVDIDAWVTNEVFNWMVQHQHDLQGVGAITINLSHASIANRDFIEEVYRRLRSGEFPADKVCFELTETVALNNVEQAVRFIRKLKETGCSFSLDDFGRGGFSYTYLRTLPIDYIKIDGAFVQNMVQDPTDYAVVRSINDIAHLMGKKTIAEKVEDTAIYDALREIGLDYVQGYAVEKPIPLKQLFA